MTAGDQVIERAAKRLDELARGAAREDGVKARLAEPLADDAALLRGMRPSRIAARLRGERTDEPNGSRPLPTPKPKESREAGKRRGPSPILLAAGAFAVGLVIAKVIDWRSHANPR